MFSTSRWAVLAVVVCWAMALPGAHAAPVSLGGRPLCEASAAVLVPCADRVGRCLLVADNEVRDRLFRFRVQRDLIDVASREPVPFRHLLPDLDDDAGEISDIEGLTLQPGGRVLVLGSHSRNTQCKPRPNRRRLLVARYRDGSLAPSGLPVEPSPAHRCDTLFTAQARKAASVRRVCAAVEAAEAAADRARQQASKKKRRKACDAARPLNAEGVVSFARPDGRVETWIGLRAPLVEGRAVLLRQGAEANRFRFDAAALIDLGGRGVRELALDGDTLWGIAGPPQDADDAFELWRLPVAALAAGKEIEAERVATLPPSAEGLAVIEGRALVLIDGDQGDGHACAAPALYTTVELPG